MFLRLSLQVCKCTALCFFLKTTPYPVAWIQVIHIEEGREEERERREFPLSETHFLTTLADESNEEARKRLCRRRRQRLSSLGHVEEAQVAAGGGGGGAGSITAMAKAKRPLARGGFERLFICSAQKKSPLPSGSTLNTAAPCSVVKGRGGLVVQRAADQSVSQSVLFPLGRHRP